MTVMPGAALRREKLRAFARRYIIKRLNEGGDDAIEELSSYLADWLHMRQAIEEIGLVLGDHPCVAPAEADEADSQ